MNVYCLRWRVHAPPIPASGHLDFRLFFFCYGKSKSDTERRLCRKANVMTVCRDDHPHVVTMLCYVLYTHNAHATAHGYIVMASGLVIVGHGHKAKCFSRSSIGGVRLITTKVVVAHTTQWLMEQKKRVIQRLLFRLCIIYDRVKCVKNYFLLLCDAFVFSVYMFAYNFD